MSNLNASFTHIELSKLSELFEKVYVFHELNNDLNFSFENIEIIQIKQPSSIEKLIFSLKKITLVTKIIFQDLFSENTSISYFRSIKPRILSLVSNFFISEKISKEFNFDNNDFLYSFFSYDIALIPVGLKKIHPFLKFITLTHQRDLYEEFEPKSFKLAFRKLIFSNANLILSVSKDGVKYLKEKHPFFTSKFQCYYLGSKNNISTVLSKKRKSEDVLIVSCGSCIKRKSIHKIPKLILSIRDNYNINIRWIHFGENPSSTYHEFFTEISKLENEDNISFEFKGRVSNENIHSFYLNNEISFLLNVSSGEGLPFSIIEAMSYGISVISTDIGGCREIINNENLLLKMDFSEKDFIYCYEYLIKNSKEIKSLNFKNWKAKFSYDKSKTSLTEILKNLN